MLKRIFPIFAVLVLLVSVFAIPSYAIGSGQEGFPYSRYSALTFETIEYNSDNIQQFVSIPFPFNSGNTVNNIESFRYGNSELWDSDGYLGYGHCGMTDDQPFPTIIGSITIPALAVYPGTQATFDLKGGQQVVDISRLRDYVISADSQHVNIVQASCRISYCEFVPNDSLNRYSTVSNWYEQYIPIENNTIMLGQQLNYFFDDMEFMFIEHIEVHVVFRPISVATPKFAFDIPTSGDQYPNLGIPFNNFVYQSDIPIQSEGGFNVTSWISDSIGGFLEFELFPGLSFNKVFYVLLVIAMLLWFIKLVR